MTLSRKRCPAHAGRGGAAVQGRQAERLFGQRPREAGCRDRRSVLDQRPCPRRLPDRGGQYSPAWQSDGLSGRSSAKPSVPAGFRNRRGADRRGGAGRLKPRPASGDVSAETSGTQAARWHHLCRAPANVSAETPAPLPARNGWRSSTRSAGSVEVVDLLQVRPVFGRYIQRSGVVAGITWRPFLR